MQMLWPRLLQVALNLFTDKFKLRMIEVDKDRLESVPETTMETFDDWRLFKNFFKSSLVIEIIRAIKFKTVAELSRDERIKALLSEWAMSEVLDDDEDNIYNEIIANLPEGRLWSSEEDSEYYK